MKMLAIRLTRKSTFCDESDYSSGSSSIAAKTGALKFPVLYCLVYSDEISSTKVSTASVTFSFVLAETSTKNMLLFLANCSASSVGTALCLPLGDP